MKQKQRFSTSFRPETAERLEQHFRDDGSTTRAEFVEKAVNFYIGYLNSERDAAYLPQVISTTMEGLLGLLEDRLSAMAFKQSVEQEMAIRVIAGYLPVSKEELRRIRGESVSSVRATNGRLTFEQIAQRALPMEEDEECQD